MKKSMKKMIFIMLDWLLDLILLQLFVSGSFVMVDYLADFEVDYYAFHRICAFILFMVYNALCINEAIKKKTNGVE